jgi:hypothetical protein
VIVVGLAFVVIVVLLVNATADAQAPICPATSAATATMIDGQLEVSCEP